MTPQELKNSILQLAIQGKLVEQRPEEGTAEELYREIQKEKASLVKAGRIKKEKPLPEIAEDEKPFDIPESWMWVRLNSIISLLSGSDLPPTKYNSANNGIPYITGASNFENDSLIINRWTDSPSNIAHKGDLLLTCKGTVGKTVILQENEVHIARQIMAITIIAIDPIYMQHYIQSQVDFLKSKAKSMIPGIERDNVLNLAVPLPPLAEQKRIVAKIEELLPLIDRYEQAWSKLEDFNKRFPTDMQKSILQMAIQGKLVEQRPEEGTGEELYQQIQKEKAALIKAGKIKKDKSLPEITDDEKPFDIPDSWKWVRLGNLAQFITKGSSPKWQGIRYVEEGLLFVTSENVGVNTLIWENKKYVEEQFNDISPRSQLQKGDLLTNIVGASIGRTAIYDLDEPANINQAVCLIRLVSGEISRYLLMFMNSMTAYRIMMSDKVDTARANISLTDITDFCVPLPPLAEQKRIVAKLEELLPLCERLK